MSTINSYILRQTLGPLFAAIGIALLVLLTERMLRLLDLVLDTGGGLTVLLQMLAFLVPHYMALALPVAFFLGVLLAFTRLYQANELDALGAAGIGLSRLMTPVILLGLGLTVLSAANFAVGQPYTRYVYRALVHNVEKAAANVYLKERTFMEVEGVTFMAERIWRNSREFARVFIYQETEADPDGGSDRGVATTAERGSLYVAPAGEKSTLLLRDGVRLETPLPGPTQVGSGLAGSDEFSSGQSGALQFDQLQVPIDLVGQDAFRPRGEDERELTLFELWRYRHAPPPDTTTLEMLADFHDRIVRSLSVLLLPFLAVPFALGPRRGRQSYGIAVGLLVLVLYNQVLNVGKGWAAVGLVSPLVGLWLPFVVLTLLSGVLFYRSAFLVPRGRRQRWSPIAALEGLAQMLRGGFAKRRASE
ncbi:LptF/LptG family permease [Pelagibius marinus]|uniref:LptF/LptG family permease n=1 Tax=Pelagibius marinus TaxID=2762760 RepID=UPI001873256F|nr:LptF/LptG family permease [Pelagibius marinus]